MHDTVFSEKLPPVFFAPVISLHPSLPGKMLIHRTLYITLYMTNSICITSYIMLYVVSQYTIPPTLFKYRAVIDASGNIMCEL